MKSLVSFSWTGLVEPLPFVLLVLLVEHDSADDNYHEHDCDEKHEEERLHSTPRRGLRVIYVL